MNEITVPQVKTPEDLANQPEEFQAAIKKIVRSHAINELTGARTYDEPAIALAPTPYAKWLTCRVAMEEYAHHVRFKELGQQIGIPDEDMEPGVTDKKPLSVFSIEMRSWEDFCVLKMLGDFAEILQVEDLLHCSFEPLRNLARSTMPEEKFHAQFGVDFCKEICATEEGRAQVQQIINTLLPHLLPFFGRARSKNNEIYRKWKIKLRSNEEMRADYVKRIGELVKTELGLTIPEVELDAA